MLTRDTFGLIAECDFCSETLETEEDDFSSAIEKMRNEKWKIFQEHGAWNHKCPSCQEDEVKGDFGV